MEAPMTVRTELRVTRVLPDADAAGAGEATLTSFAVTSSHLLIEKPRCRQGLMR